PVTLEQWYQDPDHSRTIVHFGGNLNARLEVRYDGLRVWKSLDEEMQQTDEGDGKGAAGRCYSERVSRLFPLIEDRQYHLAFLGEANVDGFPAFRIQVNRKPAEERCLYFDKKTGLLVKVDEFSTGSWGKFLFRETLYSEFKVSQGLKVAMRRREFVRGQQVLDL